MRNMKVFLTPCCGRRTLGTVVHNNLHLWKTILIFQMFCLILSTLMYSQKVKVHDVVPDEWRES